MALGKETVREKCMLGTHVSTHTTHTPVCMPWTSFLDKSAGWTQRFSHTRYQALFWWSTAHGPGVKLLAVASLILQLDGLKTVPIQTLRTHSHFLKLPGRCKDHMSIFSSEVNELPVCAGNSLNMLCVVFIMKMSRKCLFPFQRKSLVPLICLNIDQYCVD